MLSIMHRAENFTKKKLEKLPLFSSMQLASVLVISAIIAYIHVPVCSPTGQLDLVQNVYILPGINVILRGAVETYFCWQSRDVPPRRAIVRMVKFLEKEKKAKLRSKSNSIFSGVF